MQFQIVDKKLKDIKADIELIFVVDKDLKHKFIGDKEAIKFNNYKGDSVLILSEAKRAYVPLSKLDLDEFRVAAAKAYNALKSLNIKSIKLASYVVECQKLSFEALAEGFLLENSSVEKMISFRVYFSFFSLYLLNS